MGKTLRKKLTFSYILLITICVVVISFLTNLILEMQFKNYISKEHQQKSKIIVESLKSQYIGDKEWNKEEIEKTGIDAIENDLFISVKDLSGNIIWDAFAYNNIKCEQVKGHIKSLMESNFPKWNGIYIKDEYPIVSNGIKVGTAEIGYYGPFFYNDNDIVYIKTLNQVLIGVGIISLMVALIFGIIMARGISNPILKVIEIAKLISKGNYTEKIEKTSDIEEINDLIVSINQLGTSLNKQEELRKRLTRDISHELRTPLSTLQSHMEAIIDGIWEPTTERIISCHEEILRLKRLVGDLEKLTKYESENLVLDKSEFNLGEVISNIVLNFEKEFLNKGVSITFHHKDISIMADKDKISQVIVNLVSNALKYTEIGRVEISIEAEKEFIKIFVKDTGIGISEKDLPCIFERFYRADESRNRFTGGAGIGLAITKAIVEAHGGNIEAVSKLNEGSEFIIKLPKQRI